MTEAEKVGPSHELGSLGRWNADDEIRLLNPVAQEEM